ncbi:MAG TPA: efflux RND transporter periplasmic adaptor subunit [Bryobacteraceae bacterium]|jgi:multidrug efflux pump subunit AcrA (membrane-fusion protein)|nr:efflux RND transporter periplasmic adaptor subunit [Bryobacteraceae bacterium]
MQKPNGYLTLLAGSLLLLGCAGKPKSGEADDAESATPVQVEAAKTATIHQTVTAEAVLYPVRQAGIVPKISAPVKRLLVERGTHVTEGQLLVVLENRDLSALAQEGRGLYQQAQAAYETTTRATVPEDLKKAATDLDAARIAVDAAKKVYESRQNLLKEGAIAQKLVDDARVALAQAQAQFDVAQQRFNDVQTVGHTEQLKSAGAQLDAAKAHLEGAETQASYAEIRSPINGIVSDRPLNVGEMVSSGSAVISVVDISEVIARANLPVAKAAGIKTGDAATISGPGGDIAGRVTVVSPAVDPNTTTIEVWVQAKNPEERLKPGLTTQLTIQVADIPNAITVPVSALLSSDEGGEKVMIVGSDSLAHEQPVKIGVRDGDDVQILSGVKPGDRVITQGALGLDDKAKVKVSAAEQQQSGAGEK